MEHDVFCGFFFFAGSDKGENEAMESCKYQPQELTWPVWNRSLRRKKKRIFFLIAAGKQTPQCYPSSVTSARTMMLFNLGSAYCLRSEYDKARKCLHQVWKTNLKTALGTNALPSKWHLDHSKSWWFHSPGLFMDFADMVAFFSLYELISISNIKWSIPNFFHV